MKTIIKWFAIVGGGLVVLSIAVLLVVPMFIDIQQFKPRIEEKVAEATGRSFRVGQIKLQLFPWAGVSLTQVQLGNPSGFPEGEFASVGAFDVKVKLLPLLFKDIQVKHLNLEGLHLVLERQKDGQVNWGFSVAESADPKTPSPADASVAPNATDLSLKALAIGQISISDSRIQWIDRSQDVQKDMSDLSMLIRDVSLDAPLKIEAFARLDGNPISIDGVVGPLGPAPGQGDIPINFQISALKQLDVKISGTVSDPMDALRYDTRIQTGEFSPRVVVDALGISFPVETTDKDALGKFSFRAAAAGDASRVSVSEGVVTLDQSTLTFTADVADFTKPDVAFSFHIDQIDLDRYLAPSGDNGEAASENKPTGKPVGNSKPDYAPIRKMVLDGELRIDKLKVGGATARDLLVKVSGKQGRFVLNPLSMALYDGTLTAKGEWDFQKNIPKSNLELIAENIQAGSLLADMFEKDVISGTAAASATLNMQGDTPALIKKSLNGSGHLAFEDGAVKGIDLGAMVQNIQTAFGTSTDADTVAQTAFTEFQMPFTLKNGVMYTERTILVSPVLQVTASGNANLSSESIDFRVVPTLVDSLKGAGTLTQITVPVLATGTFQSPRFRPDVSGLVEKKLQDVLPGLLDSTTKSSADGKETPPAQSVKESVKGLLKGLPIGQ